MNGSDWFNANKWRTLHAHRESLKSLVDRCQDPLTANLSKDEAIQILTSCVKGDFEELVSTELADWRLFSAVYRAR